MSGRVVLAATRSVPGGAQRALATLAPGLRRAGWEVEATLAEPGWLAEALVAEEVAVRIADRPQLGDADAVLALGASGHAWAGAAAAEVGVPTCWWVELGHRDRPVEREALAIPARAIVVPTPTAGASYAALAAAKSEVVVVPPGVDPGPIDAHRRAASSLRARLVPPGAVLAVLVARLDPIKGQDVAIDAVARLREAGRDVRLALVGGAIVGHEGDLEGRLRARAAGCGLGDAVTFAGQVDDAGPWHAAADVAVHAAAHEAFGLAVVEALAHGVPVVATETDGPSSILAGGTYGLLVDPGDERALAAGIARVLDEPALAARLGTEGPVRAAAFSPEAAAAAWSRVLGGVVAGRVEVRP